MASIVDICNRALTKIGESRIISLADDSKAAQACNHAFEFVRDFVLAEHPWNCTIDRATLAPLSAAPLYGYNYQYTAPSDSLKIIEADTIYTWVIESGKILTDEGPVLNIKYQKRITDTTKYSPLLFEVIAARLAFEICEDLTQSNSKKATAYSEYQDALIRAKKNDSQEGAPSTFKQDEWINVRY